MCLTLPRIFELIALNSGVPQFVSTVGCHLRVLETEIRDVVYRAGAPQGSSDTPKSSTPAPAAAACGPVGGGKGGLPAVPPPPPVPGACLLLLPNGINYSWP